MISATRMYFFNLKMLTIGEHTHIRVWLVFFPPPICGNRKSLTVHLKHKRLEEFCQVRLNTRRYVGLSEKHEYSIFGMMRKCMFVVLDKFST